MGSPSYPQSPGGQAGPAQPSTAEIPVVRPAAAPVTKQLPPHPGATSFGAASSGATSSGAASSAAQPTTAVQAPVQPQAQQPQPTGPVDFVPGLPGLGTPPPPPAAAPPTVAPSAAPGPAWPETLETDGSAGGPRTRGLRLPGDRGALVPIGLAALAVVLLQLGLALELGSASPWDAAPLWSAFATAAGVAGLLGLVVAAAKRGRPSADQAWRAGAVGLVGLSVFWVLVVLPVADGDRGFLLTAALGCLGAALWMAADRD